MSGASGTSAFPSGRDNISSLIISSLANGAGRDLVSDNFLGAVGGFLACKVGLGVSNRVTRLLLSR